MVENEDDQFRVRIIKWGRTDFIGSRTKLGWRDWNRRLAGETAAEQRATFKVEMN